MGGRGSIAPLEGHLWEGELDSASPSFHIRLLLPHRHLDSTEGFWKGTNVKDSLFISDILYLI